MGTPSAFQLIPAAPKKARKPKAAPAAAAVPEVAAAPEPQPVAQPAPAPQPKAQRRSRGINLAPKMEAKACRYGTKQATPASQPRPVVALVTDAPPVLIGHAVSQVATDPEPHLPMASAKVARPKQWEPGDPQFAWWV